MKLIDLRLRATHLQLFAAIWISILLLVFLVVLFLNVLNKHSNTQVERF